MADCFTEPIEGLRSLSTPARNNYFYGKLLDVRHFTLEQSYFNAKRWLMNRLTLGSGVVWLFGHAHPVLIRVRTIGDRE